VLRGSVPALIGDKSLPAFASHSMPGA
jgi:hypothetical protein